MKKLMLIFIIAIMLVSCGSGSSGSGESSPAGSGSSTTISLSNNADISSFAESMWIPVGGGTVESNATVFSLIGYMASSESYLYAMTSNKGMNSIYYTNVSAHTLWARANRSLIPYGYNMAYGVIYNGAFYIGGTNYRNGIASVYMASMFGDGTLSSWLLVGRPTSIPGGVIYGFTMDKNNGVLYLGVSNGVNAEQVGLPAVISSNINTQNTGSPWVYHGENPILSGQNPPWIMRNEYYNGYVYALLSNSEVYVSEGMKWYIVGGYAVGGGNHGAAQQTCMVGSKLYVATQAGNVYVTNLVSSPIGSNWALVGNASARPSGNVFLLLTCDSVNSKVIATTYDVESSESSVINHVFISNVSESHPQGTQWQLIGTPILPDRNKVISSIKVVNSDLYVGDGNGNVYVLNPEYAAAIGGV